MSLEDHVDFYTQQMLLLEEEALREREELGLLIPKHMESHAFLIPNQTFKGSACLSNDTPQIFLNVLQNIQLPEELPIGELNYRVQQIDHLFGPFLSFIKDPQQHYASLLEDEQFTKFSAFEKVRGRDPQRIFEEHYKQVNTTRELWDMYVSALPQAFNASANKTYRHELEHAVHLQGPLKTNKKARDHLLELERIAAYDTLTDEESHTLASLKHERLQERKYKEPIREALAHVFSSTEPMRIKEADFFVLKEGIKELIYENYLHTFSKEALSTAVSKHWAEKNMNVSTSNTAFGFLEKTLYTTTNYPIGELGTDQELVSNLFKSVQEESRAYIRNVQQATEATIHAFMHEPAVLNEAIYAHSLEEFVAVCNQ